MSFEFNQKRLLEILPEDMSNLYAPEDFDRAPSREIESSERKFKGGPSYEMTGQRHELGGDQTFSFSESGGVGPTTTMADDIEDSVPERPISNDPTAALLRSLDSRLNKTGRQAAAREQVVEQAFLRCLSETEKKAQEDDYLGFQIEKSQMAWARSERHKREKLREECNSLKKTLDTQLDDFNSKLAAERLDRKMSKMSFLLPNSASGEIGDGTKVSTTSPEDRDRLAEQIRLNEKRRVTTREQTVQEEREYLDHIAMELDMQNAVDRAKHLEKQRVLLEAWERDGHIRNLKKLQACGAAAIQGYMETNLPDASGKLKTSGSNSGMLGMSVGFDARGTRK